MLPSVSVPTVTAARPAAAATPEPELEPDGFRSSACGLAACPPSVLQPLVGWVDRKLAHSDRFALPRITAPASRKRVTSHASPRSAPARAGDPAVAGIPRTAMLSLIRTGMPSSGRAAAPLARASSMAWASASASPLRLMTECSRGSRRSIRLR